LLAGHVELADRAFVSGNCVVHQHVRIGRLALLRGLSRTSRDVPPFCIIDGTHTVRGVTRSVSGVGFDSRGSCASPCRHVLFGVRRTRPGAGASRGRVTSPTTCELMSSSVPRSAAYACRPVPAAGARRRLLNERPELQWRIEAEAFAGSAP
jgi:hypothetical protein